MKLILKYIAAKSHKAAKMKSGIFKSLFFSLVTSLCILAQVNFAVAQTAGILAQGVTQFFDNNGNPLSLGTVNTYIPGTSTPKTTWQDAGETIPNTNPIVLDIAGRTLLYGAGTYREVVKAKNGNLIWDAVTQPIGVVVSQTLIGDGQPVGTVKPWAAFVAPSQYTFAGGQTISRTAFAAFYAAITITTTGSCSSGNPALTGVADTSQIPVNAPIESTCFAPGATVVSKTSSSVTLSSNALISSTVTAIFYPWGNGDGTTTFNVPDLRGVVLAGRPNMGGTDKGNLTSTYYGINPDGSGAVGGNQSTTLAQTNLPNINLNTYTPGTVALNTIAGSPIALWDGTVHNYTGGSGVTSPASDSGHMGQLAFTSLNLTVPPFTPSLGGSGTPISVIQPTVTINYVVKITPDINSSIDGIATTTGINIFSGDNYFGSGRPWCDPRAQGALGNGSTDDDLAFSACLTILTNLSPTTGGEIFVPPGHYCLSTGVFAAALAASPTAIGLVGPGRLISNTLGVSWLDTCGADVDLIHLSATGSYIKGLRLTGAPFTTNSAHNALTITNASIIENSLIEGGYYAITTASNIADWTLIDNNIRNSYGPSVIKVGAAGGYLIRNKVDGASTGAAAPTAWMASTSVTSGQTVTTNGPNSVSYIIKYNTSGTTGSSAPTLTKYGTTITDGTATATLGPAVNQYGLEINASFVISEQNDFSGNYLYGIHLTGTGAQFISVSDDATANLSGSILIDNGQASILSATLGSCLSSPCKAVNITTSDTAVTIGSGSTIAGATTGIEYDAGTMLQVTGVRFNGLTNAINIGTANLSNIAITGNTFGFNSSAVTNAIIFQNGTSDYVNIIGNTFQLVTTPFTGTITGVHNTKEINGTFFAPTVSGNVNSTGSAPTCTATGIGSTGTCTLSTNSNDFAGAIVLTAGGSGVTSTGSITLTLNSALGVHGAACTMLALNSTGTWTAPVTFINTGVSATAPVFSWTNASTNLINGSIYDVFYHCIGI